MLGVGKLVGLEPFAVLLLSLLCSKILCSSFFVRAEDDLQVGQAESTSIVVVVVAVVVVRSTPAGKNMSPSPRAKTGSGAWYVLCYGKGGHRVSACWPSGRVLAGCAAVF